MCRGSQRHGAEGSQVTRRQNPRHRIQQGPHHPTPAVKYRAGIAVASPSPASESPPSSRQQQQQDGHTADSVAKAEERGERRRAESGGERQSGPAAAQMVTAARWTVPRSPSSVSLSPPAQTAASELACDQFTRTRPLVCSVSELPLTLFLHPQTSSSSPLRPPIRLPSIPGLLSLPRPNPLSPGRPRLSVGSPKS